MNWLYIIAVLVGLGFFAAGIRQLLTARQHRTEGQSSEALSLAVIFLMIGAITILIGVAVLFGWYVRSAPA
jgi:uncharacterized membrane protein HdeD (DUF308 family)